MIHRIGFKHAFDGIIYILSTQPNFRVHFTAALLVILTAFLLNVSWFEFIILLFTIILVLTAEMVNTAIESMTDLITSQHHLHAKVAKDVAAGMVLFTAILSVIVGFVIFLPYLSDLFLRVFK